MTVPRTFGLIPAAGKSTRMGRPKLALPLGGCTVLECVIAAVRSAGVEDTLVVVGPHVPELVPLARTAGAHVLLLREETADMRATVEHGLRWLEEHFQPTAQDFWLLLPADHPTLNGALIRQLLAANATHPEASLFIPTYQNRRGHPALIGWNHVASMRKLPQGEGVNTYLRRHAGSAREVDVADVGVLCDLDTPEAYARLRANWQGGD